MLASGVALADEETPKLDQTSTRAENVDLFFATDSAGLDEDASSDLEKLADWAKCDSRNAVILEGYADPTGSKAHNLTLSGERAAAVRQRLIDMGVPSERIVVTIYGELGERRDSYTEDRRVTARATATPITPDDLSI
jgi:outer membrane protein OmpA-like peptidoglycan-associated protein